MRYRAILMLLSLLLIAALFAGCVQEERKEIRIGVVASMTGSASTTGRDIWESAVLAAEEINAKGGVYVSEYGRRLNITLVQGDDESSREGGQKAVSKLITQDNVDLLVGGFSSAVVSAHQSIVAEHKVPYIVSGASSSTVSRRTDIDTSYMFFHRPNTEDSAAITTEFIGTVLRNKINDKFGFGDERPLRLAIVYQDSPYGKGQRDAARAVVKEKGLNVEIVTEEAFTMGESDFRTVLTNVKAAKPDAVFAVTFLNELIPMMQQARRDVGLNTIFLGVEPNDDPDYYKGVGRYGEYSVLQSRFSPYAIPAGPTANATKRFREDYIKRWGDVPSMMGVATYEAVYIASAAVEKAGTLEKSKVRDALATIELPEMVEMMRSGAIRFSPEYRESKFELYIEQLYWNESQNELRPKIVWPDSIKETDFVLPDWYTPGSG